MVNFCMLGRTLKPARATLSLAFFGLKKSKNKKNTNKRIEFFIAFNLTVLYIIFQNPMSTCLMTQKVTKYQAQTLITYMV
mmetsp:Transcript_17064/g.21029  ORF Transcript_17064/g.21029 Transcript_17064/m.21029 type:complete len:80 (-) Transcript_17064:58-297(-)